VGGEPVLDAGRDSRDQRIADESSKATSEAMASRHFGSLASAMRVHRGREIRE
jgi:hypothetical protein